jgi:hypothetical protein
MPKIVRPAVFEVNRRPVRENTQTGPGNLGFAWWGHGDFLVAAW